MSQQSGRDESLEEPGRDGLALYLLGSPRTELDGRPIVVDRRKATALLSYLALTQQTHRRDSLATLFWPDYDQVTARGNLRNTLSVLNKALAREWLEIDRESVSLKRATGLWIDVEQFQERLARCHSHGHPPGQVCPDCLPPLSQAAALYSGDFLTGFSLEDSPDFDDWQRFQAEDLRQKLAEALEKLGQGYAAQADFKTALGYARRRLALDPLHEPAHRCLMQLYAWNGDRAAALHQYEECVRIFAEEFGLPPDAETTALYEQIRAGEMGQGAREQGSKGAGEQGRKDVGETSPPVQSLPELVEGSRAAGASPPRHNLPVQTTPFLGREAELAELARLLAEPTVRLVTILGPGGMGKSRLALETAARQLDRFEHGAYYVRLAPLTTPESIIPAIAEALNFSFYEGGTQEQQLRDYLHEKRLLLVLDNYEHLLAPLSSPPLGGTKGGAEIAAGLLKVAPGLKILATSRARLNLQEEHRFPISGIDFPETMTQADVSQSSAVQLFLVSARRVQAGFALTAENSEPVVRICQLVQGMPLGIILAATWLELLTPAEIAAELARSLDFLATELADLPQRQRSMRAVFDHSWRLLSEPEQEVFQQLSVFRGGFSREAAEAVTGASLPVLLGLANKSLLQRAAEGRYEVHELLQQYGAEKLHRADKLQRAERLANQTAKVVDAGFRETLEVSGVRDRHSRYYIAFLQQQETYLKGPRQQTVLAEIEVDLENARLAWDWAIKQGQIEQIEQGLASLYEFYRCRNRFPEGLDAFKQAAEQLQETDLQSQMQNPNSKIVLLKLLARQGAFYHFLGHSRPVQELLQESLEIARQLEAQGEIAFTLNVLAHYAMIRGAHRDAEQMYQESLAIFRERGDQFNIAAVLEGLANIYRNYTGEYAEAKRLHQECLTISRETGHPQGIASALDELAGISGRQGEYAQAEQYARESLAIFKEIGDQLGTARALGALGLITLHRGGVKSIEAKPLLEESLAIGLNTGHRDEIAARYVLLGHVVIELGEFQEGQQYCWQSLMIWRELDDLQGIAYALVHLGEAAVGLADFQAVRQYLTEGLHTALKGQTVPMALIGVNCWATLLVKEANQPEKDGSSRKVPATAGQEEQAVELLALVQHHPATWRYYKDKAAHLLAKLEAELLPPEIVRAAQERGQAQDLWQTVEELLAESGQPKTE
jgi:predicted ATPase/DNA-binding SARP family transcriptional activator